MREIIFDTETTGFAHDDGDRLVEIGCIEVINGIPTGKTFQAYCNPERDSSPGAEEVHGLTRAFLSEKPFFAEIADDLLAFIGDSPLIAHNASFDFGFLNMELSRCGRDAICLTRMIDTVALARKRHPGAKTSLDALCTRYGIDRSHRTKHGALLDAELLAQVYIELNGGRQIGLELAAEGAWPEVAVVSIPANQRPYRTPRPHVATAEELARHVAFLQTVQSPLWQRAR